MLKRVLAIFIMMLIIISSMPSLKVDAAVDKTLDKYKSEVTAASKKYKTELDKLAKLNTEMPAFSIQGEISTVKGKELYLWGTAFGNSNAQNPGWQIKDGNIKILNPDTKKINYIANFYFDSNHYYIKNEYGYNAFGAKVPIKVYSKTVPAALKIQQDKVTNTLKTLKSKGAQLEKYTSDKYNKLLQSTTNANTLKSYANEVLQLHNFIVQNNTGNNLFSTVESYYQKILKIAPKDIDTMYSFAEFYKSNNLDEKAQKIYAEVAKGYPDEFSKRVNEKTDIWFLTDTLYQVGYSNYSVTVLERYITSNPKTLDSANAVESYVRYLYDAAVKMQDNDEHKKGYLERCKNLISKYGLDNYGSKELDIYNDVVKLLDKLYTDSENIESLANLIKETGLGNFSKTDNCFENEKSILALADYYAKKGDLKNSYSYFNMIIQSYNKYNDYNQNKDLLLESDNDYSNLLLGIAYLSYTRIDREEAKCAIKYIYKAYTINPQNAIVQNAMGYIFKQYYLDYPDKFESIMNGTKLSEKELVLKVFGHYNEAIRLNPNYKIAYGNLYNLYSEDYRNDVKEAILVINNINKDDYNTYYTVTRNLKDTYYEKSKGKSGSMRSGIEIIEDF